MNYINEFLKLNNKSANKELQQIVILA